MTDLLLNMLKDKKQVIKFCLDAIERNEKQKAGVRKISSSENIEFKTQKLIEVTANQSHDLKTIALILLCYVQSSSMDSDLAKMLGKMGKGDEAIKQMFKNKFN